MFLCRFVLFSTFSLQLHKTSVLSVTISPCSFSVKIMLIKWITPCISLFSAKKCHLGMWITHLSNPCRKKESGKYLYKIYKLFSVQSVFSQGKYLSSCAWNLYFQQINMSHTRLTNQPANFSSRTHHLSKEIPIIHKAADFSQPP